MIWEFINLSDWKTKKVILKELEDQGLKLNERQFRKMIKANNRLFYEHDTEMFIVHGNRGYKATKDYEEILKSLADNKKRALNMLYEEKRVKKALEENNNLTLNISKEEMI